MPDAAPKQRRTRSRLPSLSPGRLASINDLSEEAIDLVCAFIRDYEDVQGEPVASPEFAGHD